MTPEFLPPPLPPSQSPPEADPGGEIPGSHRIIIGQSVGGVLLFIVNLVLTLVIASVRQEPRNLIQLAGSVMAGLVIVPAVILGMAACWRVNRRPQRMLQWFFGIMAGLFFLKVVTLAAWYGR